MHRQAHCQSLLSLTVRNHLRMSSLERKEAAFSSQFWRLKVQMARFCCSKGPSLPHATWMAWQEQLWKGVVTCGVRKRVARRARLAL